VDFPFGYAAVGLAVVDGVQLGVHAAIGAIDQAASPPFRQPSIIDTRLARGTWQRKAQDAPSGRRSAKKDRTCSPLVFRNREAPCKPEINGP